LSDSFKTPGRAAENVAGEGDLMPTPYLIVSSSREAIDFYTRALGAKEIVRLEMPDGKIGHAELDFAGEALMLADEFPELGFVSPARLGGSAVSLYLRVPDVDAAHARALAAGAREREAPADQIDGDRRSAIIDPFGHAWSLATRKEDVLPAELVRRFRASMNSGEQR
jgi:PhnB protein